MNETKAEMFSLNSGIAKSACLAYSHFDFLQATKDFLDLMIVGTEWLVEATNCHADKLRDLAVLQNVFACIIADLELKVVGETLWHKFPAPGAGVTGLVMLTESHLACHTYPESNIATFNLYCCRTRPEWDWEENLQNLLGAESINVQKIERGTSNATVPAAVSSASRARLDNEAHHNPFQTSFGTIKIRNHSRQDDGVTAGGERR